jgi:hypothetical protein
MHRTCTGIATLVLDAALIIYCMLVSELMGPDWLIQDRMWLHNV